MRECSEHEITIEKLLNVVHSYTDPIRIQVLIADAWLTCEEARGTRRLHDFYLTKAHTKYDDEEKERLLKYYKDVPVWNITAVWSGLIGIVIFGIALYHIIGWSIAPNASAFMWIINQIGGGQ